MEKILTILGAILLVCALVAAAIYGWQGHWGPVVLTLGAAFIGKMALGLAELIVAPISLSAVALAKRNKRHLALGLMTLSLLASRAGYTAYCFFVLDYFLDTPGPPTWLSIILALMVATAPFHWASQRTPENQAPSLDLLAATLGVPASGILLLFGVAPLISLMPLALLFAISAVFVVSLWEPRGLNQQQDEIPLHWE